MDTDERLALINELAREPSGPRADWIRERLGLIETTTAQPAAERAIKPKPKRRTTKPKAK